MIDVISYWINFIGDIISSLWLLHITETVTLGGLCVGCLVVGVICSFLFTKLVR